MTPLIDIELLASIPTVTLVGIDQAIRAWIMQSVPQVQYALTRRCHNGVVVYGDNYESLLQHDYRVNSEQHMRAVLCLTHPCCATYLNLLSLHVRHIVHIGTAYDREALRLALGVDPGVISPGRPIYSLGSAADLRRVEKKLIHTAEDVALAVDLATRFAESAGLNDSQQAAAGLVVKEAITNALFHAFRKASSHERKYEPGAFTAVEDNDRVKVVLVETPENVVIRVSDNSGALPPLKVANSLDRQTTERGLMDSRGRGFYLMRQMTDRLVVIVTRGRSTACELYFSKTPQGEPPQHRHFELLEL